LRPHISEIVNNVDVLIRRLMMRRDVNIHRCEV
jgi:hypothetical protein